ncbi:ATP-binding protein [Caulobacter sp. KR2-114]|uniref:ATP-binding protein n=1 Tax=Caulobacter sp. KR2-114 TaxID=3400912 RepID=UPI003BFB4BB7
MAKPVRPWTDVLAYRQRDRRIILPLTVLAAGAAWAFLGPAFALAWLAANLAVVGCGVALCDWIARRPAPGDRLESALALYTFIHTVAYCALPIGLADDGTKTAVIAGMSVIGGVAMSSLDELAISRRIGGAALGAALLCGLVGALIAGQHPAHGPAPAWLKTGLALSGVLAFFGYVYQAAAKRIGADNRMAEALAVARRKEHEAAEANAAKTTFLATMSHEIRTPLNGVLGMAQAMAAGELSDEQRQRLSVIRQAGQSLTAVLNDVLDLSKIEAGLMQIEATPFDLGETLQAAVSAFAQLAEHKGLTLNLQIEPEALGQYRGDPTRLRQVAHNLVSNAVKFTAEGAVEVTAWTGADGWLSVAVADSGPGIADDQRDKLFDKFVQLDASTTRRHGGSGLGLAICRELLALMGGRIALESAPGRGSTFTLSLPLERLAATGAAAAVAETAPLAGPPLRILAAEDNEANRLVLAALLGHAGADLTIVTNGAEAVDAWAAGDWDVVLMDVQMPVMDGVAAVQEIRRREAAEARRPTPVIALTANAMTHQVAEMRAAGMDDHVGKPIDIVRLFAAIEAAVARAPAAEDASLRAG